MPSSLQGGGERGRLDAPRLEDQARVVLLAAEVGRAVGALGAERVAVERVGVRSTRSTPASAAIVSAAFGEIDASEKTAFTPVALILATRSSISAALGSALSSKLGMTLPTKVMS